MTKGRTSKQINVKRTVTSTRPRQTSGNSVQKAVRSELSKYIEPKVCHYSFGAQVSANGTVISLTNALSQGDAAIDNYTGYRIKPVRLQLNCSVSTDQTFSTVRLMVFRWKDSSTPSPSGVLDAIGSGWASHSNVFWPNTGKVAVLFDHMLALKPRVSSGYDNQEFRIDLDLSNQPTIYLPQGTTGASPQLNGLYVIMASDDLIANFPAFVWRSRLTFTDA